MNNNPPISAIIWDYDGTIVNSLSKNLEVTRIIFKELFNLDESNHKALESEKFYFQALQRCDNWQHLYATEFHLAEEQIQKAGSIWGNVQKRVDKSTPVYQTLKETLEKLNKIPNGIVSQNDSRNIQTTLEKENIDKYFSNIIGYNDVSNTEQKPHPRGLLSCIERFHNGEPSTIFFIGDHHTDIEMVNNTKSVLSEGDIKVNVISVLAQFTNDDSNYERRPTPDFILSSPKELIALVENYL